MSFFLRDQFHLFIFFTYLHKTTFPLSFAWVLVRVMQALSMVSLHSLKWSVILSSDTLCSSRSWIITSSVSLSCLLSQFTFHNWLCDTGVSIYLSANYLLNSQFCWYNSAISSYAFFSCCDDSLTFTFSSLDFLLLSPISMLKPSTGSSRTKGMSNLSAT